jgi:hypothetical protein
MNEQGQPSSALQAIYGYRRVMLDCERHVCDMKPVCKLLKGLCRDYIAQWGEDAFVRTQCKTYSLRTLHANTCLMRRVGVSAHGLQLGTKLGLSSTRSLLPPALARTSGHPPLPGTPTYVEPALSGWMPEAHPCPTTAAPPPRDVTAISCAGPALHPNAIMRSHQCVYWGAQSQYFRYDDSDT